MSHIIPRNSRLIYSNAEINQAIAALADRLNAQLRDKDPLVLCVMQGGLVFSGQLIPQLTCMLDIDYIHATRYNDDTQGGELRWKAYPDTSIQGRHVLILDDILDEGMTLDAIIRYCESQGASQVSAAVLLRKTHQRCLSDTSLESSIADNIALTVDDHYVFGYGMDYNGKYRQLDAIYALDE